MMNPKFSAPALAVLAATAALAGCMSTPSQGLETAPADVAVPVEIPAPEGPYLWACNVQDESTGAGWLFTIVAQANETGQELVLQIPGSGGAMPLGRRVENEVEIYESGGTRIGIAPDGAAEIAWPGQSASFAAQCRAGESA